MKKVYLMQPLTDAEFERLHDIWPSEGQGYYLEPNKLVLTIVREPRDITKCIRFDNLLNDIRKKGGRVEEL